MALAKHGFVDERVVAPMFARNVEAEHGFLRDRYIDAVVSTIMGNQPVETLPPCAGISPNRLGVNNGASF